MAATVFTEKQGQKRKPGPLIAWGLLQLFTLTYDPAALRAQSLDSETGKQQPQSNAAEATKPLRHAVAIQYGRFVFGKYAPNTNNNFSPCTAITFCSEKGLFGNTLALTYTRRLWQRGSSSLDTDMGVQFGEQAVQLDKRQVSAINGGPSTSFGLLTLVPTYRLQLPKPLKAIALGAGFGLSVATSQLPSEQPYEIPVNTQFNLEVALKPTADKSLELLFSLQHRCSFFGLMNTTDGRYSGSQWYAIGLRKWF